MEKNLHSEKKNTDLWDNPLPEASNSSLNTTGRLWDDLFLCFPLLPEIELPLQNNNNNNNTLVKEQATLFLLEFFFILLHIVATGGSQAS